MKLSGPVELIKKSFAIFFKKENLIYFLKIYAILVPFTIISLFQNSLINSRIQSITDPLQFFNQYMWLIIPGIFIGLAGLIISFWVGASGILAIDRVTGAANLSAKETLAATWKMLFKFSVLDILIGLIVTLGFVLLIIPGILFWVWFYFAGFELITKGTGIKESLGNSKKLVAGRFWAVVGRLIIFGLFSALAGFLVSIIPYGAGRNYNYTFWSALYSSGLSSIPRVI